MSISQFSVTCDQSYQAGKPWKVTCQDLAGLNCIVVDVCSCTSGIYRYFPLERDQMEVCFRHPAAGRANMIMFRRDQVGSTLDGAVGVIKIAPASGRVAHPGSKSESGDRNRQVASGAHPQTAADLSEALRQQVEARTMQRSGKILSALFPRKSCRERCWQLPCLGAQQAQVRRPYTVQSRL